MTARRELIFTVLGVLVSVHYVYFSYTTAVSTRCQAKYNRVFAEQVYLRAEFTARADAAVDGLISGFVAAVSGPPETNPKVAQARTRKLFLAYRDARAEVTAAKAANPLPVPPDCG